MDLATFFYRENVGRSTSYEEESRTRWTIQHLIDSGFSPKEIVVILLDVKGKTCFQPEDIPDEVYKNSLTKRGHYYCHNFLQLLPPTPIVRKDGTFFQYPYYQEMRARVKEEDLARYFYAKFPDFSEMSDFRNVVSQIKYLLKSFRGIRRIEPVDILLTLIDEAAYQKLPILEFFDLKRADILSTVVTRLQHTLAERHAKGYDQIIWRNYVIDDGGNIAWQIKKN